MYLHLDRQVKDTVSHSPTDGVPRPLVQNRKTPHPQTLHFHLWKHHKLYIIGEKTKAKGLMPSTPCTFDFFLPRTKKSPYYYYMQRKKNTFEASSMPCQPSCSQTFKNLPKLLCLVSFSSQELSSLGKSLLNQNCQFNATIKLLRSKYTFWDMLTTEWNARRHKLKTQGQMKPQVYIVRGKKWGLVALFWKLKVVFIFCLAHKE